jgi:hypothetical protein
MIVWMSVTAEHLPGASLGNVATHNRYCLIGLDGAGNAIRGVRVSGRMPAVYWPSGINPPEKAAALYGPGFDWRFYDGYRSDGTPVLLWSGGEAVENVEQPIRAFHAAPERRVTDRRRRRNGMPTLCDLGTFSDDAGLLARQPGRCRVELRIWSQAVADDKGRDVFDDAGGVRVRPHEVDRALDDPLALHRHLGVGAELVRPPGFECAF